MEEMTLLAKEQVCGINRLNIIKKYGRKCEIKDFAILLGAKSNYLLTNKGNFKRKCTGSWLTKTLSGGDVLTVTQNGNIRSEFVWYPTCGIRPVLPYSSISSVASNVVRGRNGILEVEYGEYPQTIVSEDYAITLESAYQNGTINHTYKRYTINYFDAVYFFKCFDLFSAPERAYAASIRTRTYFEYEYNGKKYIRFESDLNGDVETLSDGRIVKKEKVYWMEVEPIKWLVDEKENIALCKNIIVSGIQFNEKEYDGNFKNTIMYKFLNEIFAKDIIPSKIAKNKPLTETEKLLKLIGEENDKLQVKIDNIKSEKIKNEFQNKLKRVYDIVEPLIKKKKEFNKTDVDLKLEESILNTKKDISDKLYKIELDIEDYLQKEKYINDIVELSNKIKSNINIDLVDIINIHNFSLNAIKCIYLLYSKVDEILNKINGIEAKDVINELNILVNKVVNIINGNIEIEKSRSLYVIGFESLKNIIIREFHNFDIKLDEYIKILEVYNREQQMLNDLQDRISK